MCIRDSLRTFMRKEYNVSDMPLAELEQSFIEQYHVYLKSDLGLKPTTVSGCLLYTSSRWVFDVRA